jgi:hypothetical protein
MMILGFAGIGWLHGLSLEVKAGIDGISVHLKRSGPISALNLIRDS